MTRQYSFDPPKPDSLLEDVVRAMLDAYNDALDRHVRPLTYEEVVRDPRHGTVAAARAAIDTVRRREIPLTADDVKTR